MTARIRGARLIVQSSRKVGDIEFVRSALLYPFLFDDNDDDDGCAIVCTCARFKSTGSVYI